LLATARSIRARLAWAPPPRLRLSEWARENYKLSRESSPTAGDFIPHGYQVDILDAITDPRVEQITVQASSRVGKTKLLNIAIGFHVDQDPCPMLMYQPNVDDARRYSKKEIAPMVRDCPALRDKIQESRARDSGNTILDKEFPGGSLELLGANSPAGFRARTVRIVMFDEVSAYDLSVGDEGDPIALGIKRTLDFWDRKIIAVSTPSKTRKIEELYLEGDQRRFLVPCPHCGVFDELVFQQEAQGKGHRMSWPEGQPEEAHFLCSGCGEKIEHRHKAQIVSAGFWQATGPFNGHASFFVWAAYSFSANSTWGHIAADYVAAQRAGDQRLKTFWNTTLGLSWTERGDAPEWRRLYERRESWPADIVPAGAKLITVGIDVQKDRLWYEVVAWGAGRESWGIEEGYLLGDPSSADSPVWKLADELIGRTWTTADGSQMGVLRTAIDSGNWTQVVYAWAARHEPRVMAVKGTANATVLLAAPRRVEVSLRGKPAGYSKVWLVGVNLAKEETYGWLRMDMPKDGEPSPAGFCHFAVREDGSYGESYLRMLTAEQLVTIVRKKDNFTERRWMVKQGEENHMLDCRVYARAATAPVQIDRLLKGAPAVRVVPPPPIRQPSQAAGKQPETPKVQPITRSGDHRRREGWLASGRKFGSRRGGWLR
jgi:phage terminase large subunit GpA-like protein